MTPQPRAPPACRPAGRSLAAALACGRAPSRPRRRPRRPRPPAWGVRFADTVLATWPDPAAIDPAQNGWEYNTGIVLFGMSKMYDATKDPRYLAYIKRWVDGYVNDQGVPRLGPGAHAQPRLHPARHAGAVPVRAHGRCTRTGRPRRPCARRSTASRRTPTAASGTRAIYPNEMWIDGIYMGQPFLVNYGRLFDDAAFGNDMAVVPGDAGREALPRSEDRPALPRVGPGPERGVGRPEDRAIADHLGPRHGLVRDGHGGHPRAAARRRIPGYPRLHDLLKKNVAGLAKTQDPKTGLWFQVHGSAGAARQLDRDLVQRDVRLRHSQGRPPEARRGVVPAGRRARRGRACRRPSSRTPAGRPVFTERGAGHGRADGRGRLSEDPAPEELDARPDGRAMIAASEMEPGRAGRPRSGAAD
ncbi:MAG: glycoside hydrolase family 88 protein [Comamonadaceae bacterium]|nr:glycoside hydrolase family 88 protein [Comamonadaceae bacterium]